MHTIKVATVDKDEKTWNFNRKVTVLLILRFCLMLPL